MKANPTVIEQLNDMNGLIHADKLSPLLGTPKDKLYEKTKAGKIPHFRVLGRVKYDPRVIARWLQAGEFGVR